MTAARMYRQSPSQDRESPNSRRIIPTTSARLSHSHMTVLTAAPTDPHLGIRKKLTITLTSTLRPYTRANGKTRSAASKAWFGIKIKTEHQDSEWECLTDHRSDRRKADGWKGRSLPNKDMREHQHLPIHNRGGRQ